MSKFTEDQIANIVGTYTTVKGEDYETRTAAVEELASENDVTVNVIRGVLVSAGVYVKKEATSKKEGETVRTTKEDIRKAFEAATGCELTSMDNMTKKQLSAFWARFVEMSDAVTVETGKTV